MCGRYAGGNALCHLLPAHAPRSNAPNAARHSIYPSGRNTSTKTQCATFGNARRVITPLKPPLATDRRRPRAKQFGAGHSKCSRPVKLVELLRTSQLVHFGVLEQIPGKKSQDDNCC